MSKNKIACCPTCGVRIPFKKFIQLNNYSVTNCSECNTRIEISNRASNVICATISGIFAGAVIVFGAYLGQHQLNSFWQGLTAGSFLAFLIIVFIYQYTYRNSELNRISLEDSMQA